MTAELLKILKRIRDEGPQARNCGICGNVLVVADEKIDGCALLRELDKVIRHWPANAGTCYVTKVCYPVEGEKQYFKDAAQNILWENPRRIALLDWLIKELECNG